MAIQCNADAHANAWGTEKDGLGLWTASEVRYDSESGAEYSIIYHFQIKYQVYVDVVILPWCKHRILMLLI